MCDTSVTDGNLGAKNKKQRLYTIKDQYAPPPPPTFSDRAIF